MHLAEELLMSTHNIFVHGELKKNIFLDTCTSLIWRADISYNGISPIFDRINSPKLYIRSVQCQF